MTLRITPIMHKVMTALKEYGEMTNQDLADELGYSSCNISGRATGPLHAAGMIRISEWLPTVGHAHPVRVFSVSKGKDAKRPLPQARRVTVQRYNASKQRPKIDALAILAFGFRRNSA